ncbi:zinc finger CCCH domain-containing 55 [Olea europaea subsp. europaea]|uniref:Zinc finger CCCH domain-containing 55 n=1 Tax=Olea europaea subsp. europaea TaxID=158383 RepID=A0A8S0VKH0_OLEEU|nr:zinc finger CCCH domain-containing 55 [Olea europaea subsp. europaea]
MGENRKRKSLWDMEDETKHLSGMSEFNSSTGKDNHSSFDSGRRHEFSASGIASAPKSIDHSGWPNWESLDGNTVAPVVDSFYKNKQDNAEVKEIGRGKSYNKNLSPGFDGSEWRKRDHTPEYDWSSSGRDFIKGKCRWGDTCRFSHHEASGDSYSKVTRNASFGKDFEQHANKNVKPLCKFFAEGKCYRDNCRFSHERVLKLNNLEVRPGEDKSSFSLDDKSKWWNGPSWDNSVEVSDSVKSSGWTESVVANTNVVGETDIGRTDNRLDHNLEDESRTWGIPKQNDSYLNREKQLSLFGESGSYDVDMDISEPMSKENIADKQKRIFHDSQLRNEDGVSHVYGQNTMQEAHGLAVITSQQDFFADSHIQQRHLRPLEDNDVNLFGSDALNEVNGSRNTEHPVLFPGQIFSQNGESLFPQHSLLSNETDRKQHLLIDLNGPQQFKISPPRLQSQMQNLQSAVKTSEMSEHQAPQFVSNDLTNEQAAQMTKSPVGTAGDQVAPVMDSSAFMAQRFVDEEQKPQVFAGLDTSSSTGRVPNSDTAHFSPLVYTVNSNPVTSSLDLLDPIRNGNADNENNQNLASATVSHSVKQKNNMHVERSSPVSTVDPVFGGSTVKHCDSPKAKEQEKISNSEVNGGGQTVDESKGGQENKHSENLDGHGKVDEGSAMKDDKGMRLFKNALVEFVKEILKPTWKEGRMSREVHKTIVKKVVDKVTSTMQGDHIPKTQSKVEQYLTASKLKITKLVEAYLERSLKTES